MTTLVWASEEPVEGTWHLMGRRGHDHAALCGAPLPFAPTRYMEDPPLRESQACAECVTVADSEELTYP